MKCATILPFSRREQNEVDDFLKSTNRLNLMNCDSPSYENLNFTSFHFSSCAVQHSSFLYALSEIKILIGKRFNFYNSFSVSIFIL